MSGVRVTGFAPIYDADCTVLLLGTMPSPASVAAGMYYSHPQNAFWRLLSQLTGDDAGMTAAEKTAFLLRNHIALWDTLQSCERENALDSEIRAQQPNDVAALTRQCPLLRAVFLNGGAAYSYYRKFHRAQITLAYFMLPSSSPTNCTGGYEKKLAGWMALKPYLG
ncbi:MAG: DNA-deoxyinosine glycosylase [Clostridia bacterium]|nr:DNA-deoxyinosine glycosylase [Clostridia bacterium]